LYVIFEKDIKEIQQSIQVIRAVPTTPSSSDIAKLGDEPAQLQRLVDAIEAQLLQVQEEKEQATKVLRKKKRRSWRNCEFRGTVQLCIKMREMGFRKCLRETKRRYKRKRTSFS
jgi:hypothetical protein